MLCLLNVWFVVQKNPLNLKYKMIVKIHKVEGNKMLLAVCDSELLGKKFEEGNKQLDMTSNFYKGEEKTTREVCDLMRNSYMINLVGEKSIKLALKEELVNEDNINKISDVPYAQVILQEG